MPAAGSQNPPTSFYSSRYQISTGLVTCTICHDPHLDMGTRPQLLRASINDDLICYQCHTPFYIDNANALLTHPVGATTNYATHQTANPLKYKAVTTDADGRLSTNIAANSDVRLVNGNISCSSCHGTHGADSSSATKDGLLMWNVDHWEPNTTLVAGDGKLLRTDGPDLNKSVLCQTCHTYQIHGSASGETLGCLVCHSAHVYTSTGPANYFVLRKSLTIDSTLTPIADGPGLVTLSFDYSAIPPVDVATVWADPLSANGYCEKCHGNLTTMAGSLRLHVEGENCRTCHEHNKSGGTYSFEASGCDGCHGYPPRTVNQGGPDGYAFDSGNGYNYSAQPFYKPENATPHSSHAGGFAGYDYACAKCHNNTFSTTHDQGSFQNVLDGATFDPVVSGGGTLIPAYATAGSGTCSNFACHSNGGKRTGDGPTRAYTKKASPTWAGTKNSIIGAVDQNVRCSSCHGNSAGTMAVADKDNSPTHAKHLNKGYTCNVCHKDTAASAGALAAGAAGGKHVDGTLDVVFDGSYNLGAFNLTFAVPGYDANLGSCGVYCHSNGKGAAPILSPDWDNSATGACGACHNRDVASGAPLTSGSHSTHINDADNEVGRNLGCADCHSNTVSGNSTISNQANHVNGAVNLGIASAANQTSCANIKCHSNGNLDGTLGYKTLGTDYIWGATVLAGCDDCHGDGVGKAYPTYANGGAGTNANSHAAHINKGYLCGECHRDTATGNALKTGGTLLHVNQAVEVSGAQIGSYTSATGTCNSVTCHGGGSPQWGATLTCSQCHLGGNPDVDNFAYNDGTTAAINQDEWIFSGHGMVAVGLGGANPCLFCHDDGVNHGAANLFRLRTNTVTGVPAGNLNTACLGCHGTAGSGVDPDGAAAGYISKTSTLKIDKYHGGAKHGLNNDGGSWCWDCHDPHGDASAAGQRIKMIQRRAAVNPDANGIPGSLTATDIIFTDNTVGVGAGGFARDAAPYAAGVCNTCHTTTAQYTQTSGKGTHGTGKCSTCHKHSGDATYDGYAFKGGGCNGCHGDTTGGNFWPDTASTATVDYPDRAGLHLEHVNTIGDAINGGGPGSATLDNKNATCVYCHPDPGGTNVNGNSHDTDTTGSPASNADSHKDGWNPATSFKNLQAGVDADGLFIPAIKRCSTTDCHSNGEFTWTWYPDMLAPATITNLTAATGTVPGTVNLTWTAPANDGAAGPNAYHYEVRYSTSAINDINWASATIAGGPPSVGRRGKLNGQNMAVYGLTPGNAYFFAVKTADEAYNWSSASNSVNAAARTDNQASVFWGVNSATSADEPGTVYLEWDAAPDHTLPVTYTIYYDTGAINYGGDDQVATTQGTNFRVTGLFGGILYNFAVRASDAVTPTPNADGNTVVVQQLAKTPPVLSKSLVEYFTSGTAALQTGTYGVANSSALAAGASRTWEAPAYTIDTNVYGTNFYCRMTNGSETAAGQATAKLGYVTGATWYDFSPAISMIKAVPPNSNKIVRFGFGGGGKVPAGSKLAVRVTNSGTLSYTVATGSVTNRGDIAVTEQLFNHLPTAVSFSPQPTGSGIINIAWLASTDQDAGHTVHYDVYGSEDGGLNYDNIIARNLPAATTSVQWDTVTAGIGLAAANNQVKVKVLAGDGYQAGDGSGDHTGTESIAWTVNNTVDTIAPSAIANLAAETRPKMGSIYLTWTAPGDDGNGKAPAAQYDIRYSTTAITTEAQFNAATAVTGEPAPDFGGHSQGYEVLGLTPNTAYFFALKTADEQGNWSLLSNSATASGGLKCGICHGTPPDDSATAGNHLQHGYTVPDCAKCHGAQVLAFNTKHQDGKVLLGFGRDSAGNPLTPVQGTFVGDTITYYQDPDGAGPLPAYKIYEDTSSGGFTASPAGDRIDNGTCFNYTSVNASGCHGPATPSWDENASLVCADCHGNKTRTTDKYGRAYDATTQNAGIVPDQIHASPPNDNHGYQGLPTDPIDQRRFVGQHEKHLNYSFRFSKGDNCRMCHQDNSHADGSIDIQYDSGAGTSAVFTPNASGPNTPGSCTGTSGLTCHGTAVTPKWDSAENIDCVNCHQFGGVTPSHVTDPDMGVSLANNGWATDPMPGNCTYCHPAGHPRDVPLNTVLVPNNVFVGINYAGGGIHLRTDIGGRGPFASEAEMCWGCHDSNGISEWGTNTKVATGSSPFNYGTINSGTSAKWLASPGVGATWASGTAAFSYKTGAIQSTHTTNPAGSSAVTLNTTATPKRYEENVDAVANIRCSNCHDVHNRNLALGDTMTGAPYLRGTWMGNPYPEDGAPQAGTVYTAYTKSITHTYAASTIGFGQVPRGGVQYVQQGGYYIDENSGNPTKGWTLESSAGLCTLCHGTDVDVLDQNTGENLWLGTNGHSNAALGGTGVSGANIFDYTHGRPVPSTNTTLSSEGFTNRVPNMANQRGAEVAGDQYFIYGYRLKTWNPQTHSLTNEPIDALAYDWGVTVDATTVDKNYHQFSCSKCHNPHASRLPKLMITNCLDISHNTWDDNKNSQTRSTASTTDKDKKPAYYASAQTCHRRDSSRNTTNFAAPENGGWNLATPW
jgi:predicted CxxxxCH...CXXCH cytochrome family protein